MVGKHSPHVRLHRCPFDKGAYVRPMARSNPYRITRPAPKPKAKFMHEVRVGHEAAEQSWLWQHVERIAGPRSFRKRTPFWAYTIVAFTTKEQAHVSPPGRLAAAAMR